MPSTTASAPPPNNKVAAADQAVPASPTSETEGGTCGGGGGFRVLHIDNIHHSISEAELNNHFSTAGKVISVKIVDSGTDSKNYGCIMYADEIGAKKGLAAMHNSPLAGMKLQVRAYRAKPTTVAATKASSVVDPEAALSMNLRRKRDIDTQILEKDDGCGNLYNWRQTANIYQGHHNQWVQNSEISLTHGANVAKSLHEHLQESIIDEDCPEYAEHVTDLYKCMVDGLMSAVHRKLPFFHVNRSSFPAGYHVIEDEEETRLRRDPFDSDDEDEESEKESEKQARQNQQLVAQQQAVEQKARKREELKKRRQEDEELLVKKRQVKDEKGHILQTLGPHPPPKLVIRSVKPTQCFPSRKNLQQRANADQTIDLSDLEREDEEDESAVSSSTGSDNNPDTIGMAIINRLRECITPLSLDSLKKLSESAKVKIKPSSSHEEYVDLITKSVVSVGREKAVLLLEKAKFQSTLTQNTVDNTLKFIQSLKPESRELLRAALGLTAKNNTFEDIWERIIAMGLLGVLTNLRMRPLKKISQEIGMSVDLPSTEKMCEEIVYQAFPRERIRVRNSNRAKKHIGVAFNAPPTRMRGMGDMGLIVFRVLNISKMRKDIERHYSPEFEFGGLKWSVLCMAHKECLALYLCQTGTVYCKFFIQLLNKDPDDTIGNEGAQKFASSSQENDWGFNSIIKFDQLLDPNAGFWESKDDSITIELGIVFVEAPKGSPAAINNTIVTAEKKVKKQQLKVNEAVVADAAAELLEQERLEKEQKRLRQLISSNFKEEERTRKELQTKFLRQMNDFIESQKHEAKRIQKEVKEAEKRAQLERAREQEKLQKAQEKNAEMRRRITILTEENTDLEAKTEALTSGLEECRIETSNLKNEMHSSDKDLSDLQARLLAQEAAIKKAEKELEELEDNEPSTPDDDPLDQEIIDDHEEMENLQERLADLLDL